MSSNIIARINSNLKRATEVHALLVQNLQDRKIAAQAADAEKKGIPFEEGKPAVEWAWALEWAQNENAVRSIAALGKAFDFAGFAASVAVRAPGQAGYLQAKTVQKVLRFADAVHTQNAARATDYVLQVLHNACRNGGALHIDDVQASLSKRMIPTDAGRVHSRADYTKGTACSQGSQVRMLALALGFADVQKGKRGDVMHLKRERFAELCSMFSVEGVEWVAPKA